MSGAACATPASACEQALVALASIAWHTNARAQLSPPPLSFAACAPSASRTAASHSTHGGAERAAAGPVGSSGSGTIALAALAAATAVASAAVRAASDNGVASAASAEVVAALCRGGVWPASPRSDSASRRSSAHEPPPPSICESCSSHCACTRRNRSTAPSSATHSAGGICAP